MQTVNRLESFLKEKKIKFNRIKHAPAYTAQEIAASAHLSGKLLAKTVIVDMGGKLAMVVLPATDYLDLPAIGKTLHCNVRLATEKEFEALFVGCEVGAMPPFGNLYGLDVYVTEPLTKDKEIAFNNGTHEELLKLAYKDFSDTVHPKVLTSVL